MVSFVNCFFFSLIFFFFLDKLEIVQDDLRLSMKDTLIDDSSAEFIKILSVSVLEHGIILVGMVFCEDNGLEYIWYKNILV